MIYPVQKCSGFFRAFILNFVCRYQKPLYLYTIKQVKHMATLEQLKEKLKTSTSKSQRKAIRKMIERAESTKLTMDDLRNNREYIIGSIKYHLFFKNSEMLKAVMQEIVDGIEEESLYYKGDLKNYLNSLAFQMAYLVSLNCAEEMDGGYRVYGKNRSAVVNHYVVSQIN